MMFRKMEKVIIKKIKIKINKQTIIVETRN